MSDEAWKALAIILPSFFAYLSLRYSKQARDQSVKNEQRINENTLRIESHDEASAARSRALKSDLAGVLPGRFRPAARPSDEREH